MLKNEACPNFFTGGSAEQYEQYRLFVVSRLPNLQVLDSSTVSKSEREIAMKMYGSPDAVPSFVLIQQQQAKNETQKTTEKPQPKSTNSNLPNLPNLGTLSSQTTTSVQPSFNLPNIEHLQSSSSISQPLFNNSSYYNTQTQPQFYFNNLPQQVTSLPQPNYYPQNTHSPQNNQQTGFQLPSLDSLSQPQQQPYRGPYL